MTALLSHFKSRAFIVHVCVTGMLLFMVGYLTGRYIQKNTQENTITSISNDFEAKKQTYEDRIQNLDRELYAVRNDLGFAQKTVTEKYNRKAIGVYSPLLEGKNVEFTTYQFKNAIIVEKRIAINDRSGVDIWEYQTASAFRTDQIPQDFAIFGGYENYGNRPSYVVELKKSWTETYRTKKGYEMYLRYQYAPKHIGTVSLNSYHPYFDYRYPAPSVLTIWTNDIRGFPTDKSDAAVAEAKEQLENFADTFELVSPP